MPCPMSTGRAGSLSMGQRKGGYMPPPSLPLGACTLVTQPKSRAFSKQAVVCYVHMYSTLISIQVFKRNHRFQKPTGLNLKQTLSKLGYFRLCKEGGFG